MACRETTDTTDVIELVIEHGGHRGTLTKAYLEGFWAPTLFATLWENFNFGWSSVLSKEF